MASTNSNAGGVEGNNSQAELEACVQKIDLNNMDDEMAEKEPAENSPAKDPSAAENSKEQEGESQEDDIELEGEEDIAKLQDHAAEQDTRIQQQQSLISTLRGELADQDNKITYLEVEIKNMKHDAREHVHQLARQTSKINDLREAFNALRRETMYRPAPRADPPANSASGRTNPSRSGGAVGDPGPSTQRAAEPSTQAFGSLPITLPHPWQDERGCVVVDDDRPVQGAQGPRRRSRRRCHHRAGPECTASGVWQQDPG
ncbi:unnamed protein product [Closterium sp. Yama58-4]|nr:unnamed protein product [Closterium sp. Yama58-4]